VDKRVGRDCPFCSGRRVTPENNLAAMHPERARQWHPTRNGDLTPQEVLPGYSRLVWWLCGTCGHEWQAKPSSRMRGSGCRECSRSFPRRATEPLSVTHPELAAQWHPTANGGATPDQVTFGSAFLELPIGNREGLARVTASVRDPVRGAGHRSVRRSPGEPATGAGAGAPVAAVAGGWLTGCCWWRRVRRHHKCVGGDLGG